MFCPANTKIVIQTTNGRLFIISIINYFNLLALKKIISEREYIEIDYISLSFCKEELNYDYQSINIYHRYFHQKYGKCIYSQSIQLKLKTS